MKLLPSRRVLCTPDNHSPLFSAGSACPSQGGGNSVTSVTSVAVPAALGSQSLSVAVSSFLPMFVCLSVSLLALCPCPPLCQCLSLCLCLSLPLCMSLPPPPPHLSLSQCFCACVSVCLSLCLCPCLSSISLSHCLCLSVCLSLSLLQSFYLPFCPSQQSFASHKDDVVLMGMFQVIVDDLDMGTVFEFPCERWFALDEDDGQISRELILNVGPRDSSPGTWPRQRELYCVVGGLSWESCIVAYVALSERVVFCGIWGLG